MALRDARLDTLQTHVPALWNYSRGNNLPICCTPVPNLH